MVLRSQTRAHDLPSVKNRDIPGTEGFNKEQITVCLLKTGADFNLRKSVTENNSVGLGCDYAASGQRNSPDA
ncbi:hypothetical protein [Duffyella gerundensis]|uniref:hypothetical protein n=1 Tax=Duffyella TaxID=3026546 RepID=UPI003F6E1019